MPEEIQRRRELSILNTIAQALNQEVDLAHALQTTLEKVIELCDLRTGWVWLLDEVTHAPYLAAAQNLPPALRNNPERMDGSEYCYCLEHYQEGNLEGAANISMITCSRLRDLLSGTDGLRFHATIPLFAHGRALGVMNVVSRDLQELSDEELRLLYTIGDLLSIAIERTRLFDRSMMLGATEERNRLARDIHDTLAQGLSGIVLQLETADALLEDMPQAINARKMVQHALEAARQNLDDARRSVLDLRATPLEGRTLSEAVQDLAIKVTQASDIQLDFAPGENRGLPPRIEMGLFRVAQEALTNAVKHAHAQHVTVRLVTMPQQLVMIIEDDGCGFDMTQSGAGNFGLLGMQERVRLLNGEFELSSCEGQGTTIRVSVPLEV